MRLPFLLLSAAPAFAQFPEVDSGFDETTTPADTDLVVVRERYHGAAGIDLTSYGFPGVHDYVQSIYVRFRHSTAQTQRTVRGRMVFPAGITVIGVISDGDDLGGTAEDGVMTDSDLDFGIPVVADDYSAPGRGVDWSVEAEHASARSNNTVDFSLLLRQDELDDFRVLIDYGSSWTPGVDFDLQLIIDDDVISVDTERGIRLGDPGGAVLGNGDYGEVDGLQGIPLTSAALPTAGPGYLLDMTQGMLFARYQGAIALSHLELYNPVDEVNAVHVRRTGWSDLARGPYGFVYSCDNNFDGITLADLDGGGIGRIDLSLPHNPRVVSGLESGRTVVAAGHHSGVGSPVEVYEIDVPAGAVTSSLTLPAGELESLTACTMTPGKGYFVGATGHFVEVDLSTWTYTRWDFTLPGGSSYQDMDADAAGTSVYLMRQISGGVAIDLFDTASGVLTSNVVLDTNGPIVHPRGVSRDDQGLVWVTGRGWTHPTSSPVVAYDPNAGWAPVIEHVSGTPKFSNRILGDVTPNAIGTRYCDPAVSNNTGQPAWITAMGSAQVSDADFRLAAFNLPTHQSTLFLNAPAVGFFPNLAGSDGHLCLDLLSGVGRHTPATSSGTEGSVQLHLDLNALQRPTGPVAVQPGETWNFQAWYRAGGGATNFTDAISVTFH